MKQIDRYQYNPKDMLGMGTTGTVVKAIDAKKNQYAIRIIKKNSITDDEGLQSALLDEMKLMQQLKHPQIVQLVEVIQTDNNYYVVMELCKQDLQTYLQQVHKLPESECIKLLIDILRGFTELISHGIIHRGLKLTNIMLTDKGYKLADCGLTKCMENFKKDQLLKDQDFKFHSPQVLQNSKYTSKCDIWSIGMILYNALYGYTPWSGAKIEQLLHNIEHKWLDFPDDQTSVSDEMKQFIEGCLTIEEANRMNWDEIFKNKLVKDYFKNYQTHIKEEQIKFLMNELRQKIVKQNLNISYLFQEFDQNGDQTLQFSELVQLLHTIDKNLSRQDCQVIFKKLDLDGDKSVSLEEFEKWITDNNTKMAVISKVKGRQNQRNSATKQITSLKNIQNNPVKHKDINPQGLTITQQSILNQSQSTPHLNQMPIQAYMFDPDKIIQKLQLTIQRYNINVHDLFSKFDQDFDSLLSFQEFAQLLIKIQRNAQPQEFQAVFKIFDLNDDNFISFIEFRQILNLYQQNNQKLDSYFFNTGYQYSQYNNQISPFQQMGTMSYNIYQKQNKTYPDML
ncbi:unnamed protein product [Paramecium pentaurelia]|uniref:Calcium-dependent protein kinase n=1 Tax=Paramecium pentaurelia TaxID=43138 RepID=A0A8S1VDN3_9CILI|nr:unnamed protein product [Paramecium pentaurelia]